MLRGFDKAPTPTIGRCERLALSRLGPTAFCTSFSMVVATAPDMPVTAYSWATFPVVESGHVVESQRRVARAELRRRA